MAELITKAAAKWNIATGNVPSNQAQCDTVDGYGWHDDSCRSCSTDETYDRNVGKCVGKSCTVAAPVNGALGDCGSSLDDGESCNPTCNDGFEFTGGVSAYDCKGGELSTLTCAAVAKPGTEAVAAGISPST